MYKLLLATDQPEIIEAFNAVTSWEVMGFRPPRIVTTMKSAIKSLKDHYVDAIAFKFRPEEDATLMEHLAAFYPLLPIFQAASTSGALVGIVRELSSLLNRTHADFSNDSFGEADMLQLCRHEFFRELLDNRVLTEEDVRRRMLLLRSRMDPDKPCVVVELRIREESNFFMGRWHYGTDRLEVALRNFFGVELAGMRMLVSVLPDQRIFLLAGAMRGTVLDESVTGMITHHAQSSIDHVREYLDLGLEIANIRVMPKLADLARGEERSMSSGHF